MFDVCGAAWEATSKESKPGPAFSAVRQHRESPGALGAVYSVAKTRAVSIPLCAACAAPCVLALKRWQQDGRKREAENVGREEAQSCGFPRELSS